jgi:tripartite-type tricarboxylate transporter receptor subunit TctC
VIAANARRGLGTLRSLAAYASLFVLACGTAWAQPYPTKTVRIINPFSPGGSLDLVARLLARHMSAELGQSVLVDNRPGAGGTIGVETVAKAPPDGYTLLIVQSSITINPTLQPKISYDPIRDFAPISKVADYMFFLVAHPSLPVRSVKQLIALDKARPGQLNYASVGVGSGTHLASELFNYMAGTKIVHVPYKGTGQALPDLIGGHVAIMFGSTSFVPHVKSKKLVALGVTGAARSPALPEVPTIAEAALPGFEVTAWNALFAPAGTPEPIINRLNVLVREALAQPEAKATMDKQGLDATPSTPGQLASLVRSELDKWARVIKASGMKAN